MGTLFITWRETLSYLTRMGVKPHASVLVIGSGGNGLAFVAHVRNLGATRVTLVGAANRTAEGGLAGATGCCDYRAATCWAQAQAEAADGYDFGIDAVGRTATAAQGQKCLKVGGTIGIYGLDECGPVTLAAGRTFTFYNGGYDEAEAHEAVLRFYRAGRLNPAVCFDRRKTFALADIGKAFEAVSARSMVKPLVKLSP